jgi:hypothetical protein
MSEMLVSQTCLGKRLLVLCGDTLDLLDCTPVIALGEILDLGNAILFLKIGIHTSKILGKIGFSISGTHKGA